VRGRPRLWNLTIGLCIRLRPHLIDVWTERNRSRLRRPAGRLPAAAYFEGILYLGSLLSGLFIPEGSSLGLRAKRSRRSSLNRLVTCRRRFLFAHEGGSLHPVR